MLARIWSGPEATSIWVEIVKERRQEIAQRLEQTDTVDLRSLAAAKQDVTRQQLADWDASTRAWLLAADEIKIRQQRQLMLIIDNIRVSVNNNPSAYSSVLPSWKDAMEGIESLIKGMPQRLRDGAVLLGLSAWHIYPDLLV